MRIEVNSLKVFKTYNKIFLLGLQKRNIGQNFKQDNPNVQFQVFDFIFKMTQPDV